MQFEDVDGPKRIVEILNNTTKITQVSVMSETVTPLVRLT